MKEFQYDFHRMTGRSTPPVFEHLFYNLCNLFILICSHQIRYMYWWRKENKKHTLFRRYKLYRYSRKYGLEISPSAKIGKGLYLGHPYNITVGGDTVLGNNVNLHKGCTIGRVNAGHRAGMPVLGNNIYVGINSTIVGGIHIGDDVLIAPNSFVDFDVPPHSVVVGNPGVIHSKENATSDYIIFTD